MILLALLQAVAMPAPVTRATSAAPVERFSVLAEPCARASGTTVGNEVVVCGAAVDTQRLPLPDERVPDGSTPSNPQVTGIGALRAEGTPCATVQRGCTVGIGGPALAAAVGGLATAVSDGLADRKVRAARRRDAGKRIAIPLN